MRLTTPQNYDEIRKRSKRPWGGALKSYKCFCCGSGLRLANHHITPREEGGSDSSRNKVTLCSTCHDALEGLSWAAILARKEATQAERKASPAQRDIAAGETLEEYFALPHTPAPNSAVGGLMLKVLRKFSGMAFETARAKANELLNRAAGKRIYRIPPVLTEEEQEAQGAALRARFARSRTFRNAAQNPRKSRFQCKGSDERSDLPIPGQEGQFRPTEGAC